MLGQLIDAHADTVFNQIQLQPVLVTNQGEEILGISSGLLPPEGPYPPLSVSGQDKLSISSLVLNPANPAEGENYVATGEVFCPMDEDLVLMDIVGTDGYTDNRGHPVTGTETQSFELWVPGAESGVRDVVTLRVMREGQEIAKRTASLVFG